MTVKLQNVEDGIVDEVGRGSLYPPLDPEYHEIKYYAPYRANAGSMITNAGNMITARELILLAQLRATERAAWEIDERAQEAARRAHELLVEVRRNHSALEARYKKLLAQNKESDTYPVMGLSRSQEGWPTEKGDT